MNPEEIQKVLEKAIAGAIKPEEKTEKNDNAAISEMAKAVQAIAKKVDDLDKTAQKKEIETPETAIEKLSKTIENLQKTVEEIKNPVNDEDKPIDLNKMTKKEFAEYISGIVNPKPTEKPKGKGKETQKTILDNADDNDEIDIDLNGIETHDQAGNALTDEQRLARKNLDEALGAKLTGILQKGGFVDSDAEEAEEVTEE